MNTAITTAVTTASPAPVVTVPAVDHPDVSFIMVTFGTGPIGVRTIESLVTSVAESDVDVEIVLVDNPHPERVTDTFDDLRLFTAGVRVLRPEHNLGFGGGCELGAMHARADVLAFVNPDVTFAAGWLEPLLAELADGPADEPADEPVRSIVAPVLLNPDGSVQEAGQVLYSDGSTAPELRTPDTVAGVHYASAACWLMTRDEHERIGGFDAAYHPAYYEDVDVALRARRLGGSTVVCPESAVVHHRGSGTPNAAPLTDRQRAHLLTSWPEIAWRQPSYLR